MLFSLHKLQCLTRGAILAATCLSAFQADAQNTWEVFTPLSHHQAATVNHNGTLHLIGGYPLLNNNEMAPTHSLAAGSSTWTSEVPLDSPLQGMIGAVDSFNRILVFGGYERDGNHGYTPKQKVKQYVPGEGLTDTMAPIPDTTLWYAGTTDDQGRTYLIGGQDLLGNGTTLVRRYNPTSDTWQYLTPLPVDGRYAGTAVFDGRGHIIFFGGYNRSTTRREATTFSYDIASDTWKQLSDLPEGRSNQSGVLGADGLIYAIAGWGGANPNWWYRQPDVFILDPITETWSVGPTLNSVRADPSSVLRDDGFIYVIGGALNDITERLDTNPARALLTVSPDPLLPGQVGTFAVTNGTPDAATFLAYSTRGPGTTYVPFLNATLDLRQPKQAGGNKRTDLNGSAQWNLPIPANVSGRDIWFQAIQFEKTTNVIATSIQ